MTNGAFSFVVALRPGTLLLRLMETRVLVAEPLCRLTVSPGSHLDRIVPAAAYTAASRTFSATPGCTAGRAGARCGLAQWLVLVCRRRAVARGASRVGGAQGVTGNVCQRAHHDHAQPRQGQRCSEQCLGHRGAVLPAHLAHSPDKNRRRNWHPQGEPRCGRRVSHHPGICVHRGQDAGPNAGLRGNLSPVQCASCCVHGCEQSSARGACFVADTTHDIAREKEPAEL